MRVPWCAFPAEPSSEYEIVPVETADAPLAANLRTSTGPITAGAFRFDPGAHGMLEILEQPSTHEPRSSRH